MIDKIIEDSVSSDKPVVVCFSATWCNPCKRQKIILNNLKSEGFCDIIILDIADHDDIVESLTIKTVPTTIIVNSGKIIDRKIGLLSAQNIKEAVNGSI